MAVLVVIAVLLMLLVVTRPLMVVDIVVVDVVLGLAEWERRRRRQHAWRRHERPLSIDRHRGGGGPAAHVGVAAVVAAAHIPDVRAAAADPVIAGGVRWAAAMATAAVEVTGIRKASVLMQLLRIQMVQIG
ncbi:hypothetical protein BC828DRAFT_174358 [Blastocladiella britannica]|nr:hypothetical protein BC828DRAFT_174358 [Blastocladiella britannica]